MNNSAGSYALLGAKVPRDSTVASKLRRAGAIILGKANLSQWANYRSNNTSNGWSAYGGQTYAAYYPKQDPGGSSSGSGVASSLGLAFATIGTETDGSIVYPAQNNGVVGIKPTVGLTSRYLVIPISEHQDTVGPMARTVKDAAYILQQIAGFDVRDNYTSAIPNNGTLPDYVAACKYFALRGSRIGVPWNAIGIRDDDANGAMLTAFSVAISLLKEAGATIVDIDFPGAKSLMANPYMALKADFPVNLATYLAELTHNPNGIRGLADVRSFTHRDSHEQKTDRNTAVWDEILSPGAWNNTDPRFWSAYQQNLYHAGTGGLLGAIANYSLDAVIMPTEYASTWAAVVGAPIITVPMGFHPVDAPIEMSPPRKELVSFGPNIPMGLSFLGAKFDEATLIGLAYAYEQRSQWRSKVEPYLKVTPELRDMIKS